MGRHATDQIIYRIVILLLSLAGLAERAVGASAGQRRNALAFIHIGEAAALGLLVDCPVEPEPPQLNPRNASSLDASILAARLRMMAWTIAILAMQGSFEEDEDGQRLESLAGRLAASCRADPDKKLKPVRSNQIRLDSS